LKNRESDDPFIPILREKQNQLAKFSKIQFNPQVFHPYRLDGDITTPKSPVKPKKMLILVFGAITGLYLGIFGAFIVEFITKARTYGQNQS